MARAASGRRFAEGLERIWVLLVAGGLGVVVAELVTRPGRRVLLLAVGLVFLGAVMSLSSTACLAALAFLLPFGVNIKLGNTNMLFILVLALLVLVRRVRHPGELFVAGPLALPMTALFVLHLVSFVNITEEVRDLALVKTFALLTCLVIFVLVTTLVRDPATLKRVCLAAALSCGATCIVAAWELTHPGHAVLPQFFYAPWSSRQGGMVRAVGTFRNYSNYAQYLAMNTMLIAYLVLRAKAGRERALLLGLLAVVSGVFLTTGMRGAIIALALGFLYLLAFGRRALPWTHAGGTAILLGSALAGGGYLLMKVGGFGTVFTRFEQYGLAGGTAVSRQTVIHHLFGLVMEHPWIGHGPAIKLPKSFTAVLSTSNPHNQYLYFLYTVGALGLLAFLWFAGRLFWEGHRTLTRAREADPFALGLLAVLQGNLVLFLAHEMANDHMFSPQSMHVTWFFFGLLVATERIVRRTSRAEVG